MYKHRKEYNTPKCPLSPPSNACTLLYTSCPPSPLLEDTPIWSETLIAEALRCMNCCWFFVIRYMSCLTFYTACSTMQGAMLLLCLKLFIDCSCLKLFIDCSCLKLFIDCSCLKLFIDCSCLKLFIHILLIRRSR